MALNELQESVLKYLCGCEFARGWSLMLVNLCNSHLSCNGAIMTLEIGGNSSIRLFLKRSDLSLNLSFSINTGLQFFFFFEIIYTCSV